MMNISARPAALALVATLLVALGFDHNLSCPTRKTTNLNSSSIGAAVSRAISSRRFVSFSPLTLPKTFPGPEVRPHDAELAHHAHVTASYVWRLESGGAAPGIDLLDRLAAALGTTAADLVPASEPADSLPVLRDKARKLVETLMAEGGRETLLLLNPLLARLP
jgi:transcriptional regulator with XRE-family HTH domain